jgi:hypothetical protein
MWIEGNYRRIFLDMHIDDWNPEFLSRLDPPAMVATLADAGAQSIVVKAKPHTGLCYWPTTLGRMHKGLRGRDYVGEMIGLCHERGIDVVVYYSQVFDNWAYDNHPAWRCVYVDGRSSREKAHRFFRKGRYGVVCPNNVEYREYVRANLRELNRTYRFEGMFLDMPFWPEVCCCASCRKRWEEESGHEIPRIVDWQDPAWTGFQAARERWMGEFAAFSTRAIKETRAEVTVEHNFATAMFPWQLANTDLVMDACDYAGGDYYGGYLQQTFACKYYRNVSPRLPFVYITSRCDPDLLHHTTTKTREEFVQHAVTALVHNGAFSICDGMNPDGSICTEAYRDVIAKVFEETRPLERYASGDMLSNVSIWFATHAKYDLVDNGRPVGEQEFDPMRFAASKVGMAAILREQHLPFDVVASRNLDGLADDVLVVSDVPSIRDGEMEAIERYVMNGGSLFVTGHLGHERMRRVLGVEHLGMTEHDFTYMDPTEHGAPFFDGFNRQNPLTVNGRQHIVRPTENCEVLATITLPYTPTEGARFASIHSNPPGIHTDMPALIRKTVGKGTVLWAAAPIETSRPYRSRRVVGNLVRSLCRELRFASNAPAFVEIVGWRKDGRRYYAAINQIESASVPPVYDVFIDVPGSIGIARIVGTGEEVPVEHDRGQSRIRLPRIDIYRIVEVGS